MKKILFIITLTFCINLTLFANNSENTSLESTSKINWITKEFVSELSLDVEKANIKMPSGKKIASAKIKSNMPKLIQPPLLSLFADSNSTLSDMVISNRLNLDKIYNFIMNGYKTTDVFRNNAKEIFTTNYLNINLLNKELIRHNFSSEVEKPIEIVPSRAYTGIIIDARGELPVHGEYVKSESYPCFFSQIFDDEMNILYEKNFVEPNIIEQNGLVDFHYSDNIADYEKRIGSDPLYIKAVQVYGRNRTDPIIKRKDALKILTVPENVELLKQGKVVILLDKKNLIYDISVPQMDNTYYVVYDEVKKYFYENKVPGLEIVPTGDGILFSIDLNFYPDSDVLLPQENERISFIGNKIKEFLDLEGYTVLVEGHTADVGKPVGQLNLSIDRAKTVMNALIAQGIDEKLFTYKAYGGTMPIATNETEEGRAQNRRVDITLRPRQTYILRDW